MGVLFRIIRARLPSQMRLDNHKRSRKRTISLQYHHTRRRTVSLLQKINTLWIKPQPRWWTVSFGIQKAQKSLKKLCDESKAVWSTRNSVVSIRHRCWTWKSTHIRRRSISKMKSHGPSKSTKSRARSLPQSVRIRSKRSAPRLTRQLSKDSGTRCGTRQAILCQIARITASVLCPLSRVRLTSKS